jgi:hypothetical protein
MLLKQGDQGPGVALVQDRLRELGWPAAAEPAFGEATRRAVMAFQKGRGLASDGVVGPRTWAQLFPPLKPTRGYINDVLHGGEPVFDLLDEIVAAVAGGEGGAFDALQLNADGDGLSFGLLQWAQNPGSLGELLAALHQARAAKFLAILGDGDPDTALELLSNTRGWGKRLALWQGEWPLRFWRAGRDLDLQKVQRLEARRRLAALVGQGLRLYPERFQAGGKIALRALVMLADVGNQAGPGGLRRALAFAARRYPGDEARFIRGLGEYVERLVAAEYGDPNFGNTRGRHEALCRQYSLKKVDCPAGGLSS